MAIHHLCTAIHTIIYISVDTKYIYSRPVYNFCGGKKKTQKKNPNPPDDIQKLGPEVPPSGTET